MDAFTARQLNDLNRQFYQTFALQFSQTRQRLQPGVRRTLETVTHPNAVLDLGCGNGELWRSLSTSNFTGQYIGIDASPGLLEIARQIDTPESQKQPLFICIDLTAPDWEDDLIFEAEKTGIVNFDFVLAFAVLHHIPSKEMREGILTKIHSLLSPSGQFIHSEWQFLKSARLKERIQAWSNIGLSETSLDPGDYLLDWRHGGQGLRYIHHFSEEELAGLAAKTGFRIQYSFFSDGQTGNLSLYQSWSAVK